MKIQLHYEPRGPFIGFHQRSLRWALMVCHRRAGKTVACIYDLILRAVYTPKRNARYAYVAPFRQQAKEIAWTYLKDATSGLRVEAPRESELRVKLPNGAWITLYGADNPDALRGLYFDGIILDEFGDMKPSLLGEVIMPCLADRHGWLAIIGTAKGRNQFFDYHKKAKASSGWFYTMLKASESGILSQDELDTMRAVMSDDQYDQEMECNFDAALQGTYYADMINRLDKDGHLIYDGTPLYDPEQAVFVAADVGLRDSTAWWFWQPKADGIALIDYYEANGKHVDHYLEMFADRGYSYGKIWVPFDAKAKTLATRRSTVEQLRNPHSVLPSRYPPDAVLPIRIVPKLAKQHGIDAVRLMLPKCYFDMRTCELGVDRLRSYRRQWDEKNQVFSDTPKKDGSDHGADAFRYFALVADQSPAQLAEPQRILQLPEGLHIGQSGLPQSQGFTLEELYEDRAHGEYWRKQIVRI